MVCKVVDLKNPPRFVGSSSEKRQSGTHFQGSEERGMDVLGNLKMERGRWGEKRKKRRREDVSEMRESLFF